VEIQHKRSVGKLTQQCGISGVTNVEKGGVGGFDDGPFLLSE